jgi:hypothetical protein
MNEFYTQIQYVFFCVFILKFVNIYIKQSMVIVLKESKCMCMS